MSDIIILRYDKILLSDLRCLKFRKSSYETKYEAKEGDIFETVELIT